MERRENPEDDSAVGSATGAKALEDEHLEGQPSETRSSEDAYLFEDLSIDCPTEEFRRVYEKKLRSFESDLGSGLPEAYRRAYELGEELIRRHLGATDPDITDAPNDGAGSEEGREEC